MFDINRQQVLFYYIMILSKVTLKSEKTYELIIQWFKNWINYWIQFRKLWLIVYNFLINAWNNEAIKHNQSVIIIVIIRIPLYPQIKKVS